MSVNTKLLAILGSCLTENGLSASLVEEDYNLPPHMPGANLVYRISREGKQFGKLRMAEVPIATHPDGLYNVRFTAELAGAPADEGLTFTVDNNGRLLGEVPLIAKQSIQNALWLLLVYCTMPLDGSACSGSGCALSYAPKA